MQGRRQSVRDAVFGVYQDVQRMIRTETWKLIEYPRLGRMQLFEIGRDPDERSDLSGDPAHAARMRTMRAQLTEWHRGLPQAPPDRERTGAGEAISAARRASQSSR
jgi:arylsulfatase A-like enzyme